MQNGAIFLALRFKSSTLPRTTCLAHCRQLGVCSSMLFLSVLSMPEKAVKLPPKQPRLCGMRETIAHVLNEMTIDKDQDAPLPGP